MADTLATLIKLAERQVEAAQQALTRTQAALAAVQGRIVALQKEAETAFRQATTEETVQGLQAATAFHERVKQETLRLRAEEEGLKTQESENRQTLQTAYGAQKRYELLHEKKQRDAKLRHEKKVQIALDEVASRKR